MDPIILLILMLVVLLVLLAGEMPVGGALAISGAMGIVLLRGSEQAEAYLGSSPFSATSSFSLTVIPMYILMGMFAIHGRLAEQLYAVANRAFRRLPGGLGVATVMACAGFGAVSGSSVAAAATMARLSIGQMIRYGYPRSFAAGVVASAGTLGSMIPPSVILVLYAITTGESTGAMLMAGVVPGIVSAIAYAIYISIRATGFRRQSVKAAVPATATAASATGGAAGGGELQSTLEELEHTAKEQASARLPYRGVVRAGILFTIVIGGIYSGVFTPTESGAIGAVFALLMMLWELRREPRKRFWNLIGNAFTESASLTSTIFFIIIGSAIFTVALVSSRVPQTLAANIASLDVPPIVILLAVLLLLLPLGMFLESISIIAIMMPLTYPIITALGYDGVWFGILVVKLVEVGMLTPPVGINCFVVAGASEVSLPEVFRGVFPFILVDLVVTGLIMAFPSIALFLPSLTNG